MALRLPVPIFLCGMMGAGKSTIGAALARALPCTFIDLDLRIERVFGHSIPDLLQDEPAFRRYERAALVSLLREPGFASRTSVVATGGGIVVDPHNFEEMTRVGVTVWLDVPLAVLRSRLGGEAALVRPLLADEGALERLHDARRSLYEACAIRVDGDSDPDSIVAEIVAALPRD